MVTAESLCCGTPVVGFNAGGPESIAIKEYCDFVNYGDISNLYNVIINKLEYSIEKNVICNLSKKRYKVDKMCDEYLSLYKM